MGAEIFNEAERRRQKRGLQAARHRLETENTYKSQVPQLKLDTTVQASVIKYECTQQRLRVFSVNPDRNVGKIRQAGSLGPDPPWICCRWVDFG